MTYHIYFDFGDYAGLIPGVVVSAVVALLLARPVARRLRVGPVMAVLLVLSLGLVLSATITPSREALAGTPTLSSGCDLSRLWFAPRREYVHIDDTSLNVLLFVPLGVLLGALPRSRYRLPMIVGAVLLPLAVELTQLLVTPLGRACQSEDLFDNLTGLLVGLCIGLVAVRIARRGQHHS